MIWNNFVEIDSGSDKDLESDYNWDRDRECRRQFHWQEQGTMYKSCLSSTENWIQMEYFLLTQADLVKLLIIQCRQFSFCHNNFFLVVNLGRRASLNT